MTDREEAKRLFLLFVGALRKEHPEMPECLKAVQLPRECREALLRLMEMSKDAGISVTALCGLLQISRRRYYYWIDRLLGGDEKTSHRPHNALDCKKQARLVRALERIRPGQLSSVRKLSEKLSAQLGFHVSHVTIWRYRRGMVKTKTAA